MRGIDRNRLKVLRRVRDFIKPMAVDHSLGTVLAELEATVARMTAEAERQERHQRQAKSTTTSISALSQESRDELLQPLARLMRKVARGSQVDGTPIEVALALPRERDYQGLISAANAIHARAQPHEATLVTTGLATDHLAEVRRVTDALEDAIDARAHDYLHGSHARTLGITEGRNAGEMVRLIDAILRRRLRTNPAMRAAWTQAKRLGQNGAGGGWSRPSARPDVAPPLSLDAAVSDDRATNAQGRAVSEELAAQMLRQRTGGGANSRTGAEGMQTLPLRAQATRGSREFRTRHHATIPPCPERWKQVSASPGDRPDRAALRCANGTGPRRPQPHLR